MEEFPHLFSFSKDKEISLMKLISVFEEDIYDHFHLPLSLVAAQECEELSEILQSHVDNNISSDQWEFEWKGGYSCKKVYSKLAPAPNAPPPFNWIWNPEHYLSKDSSSGSFC